MLAVHHPMLAAHRPGEMASQQPSDTGGLPFGYAIDAHQQRLFFSDPPPEPAPGPPLLSDLDFRETDDFFETINAGNYHNVLNGEGLNFTEDWLYSNLPPQYVGSTTSFGQQPSAVPLLQGGSTSSSSMMPPPPVIPQPQRLLEQEYSADVLAAATTLSQNGAISHLANGNHGDYFGAGNMASSIPNDPHRPLNGVQNNDRHMAQPQITEDGHTLFVDMLHGQASRPPTTAAKRTEEVKFGSDISFGRDNFTPRSDKETLEALEQERLTYMGCLEVNQSAANTRPSSPVQEVLQSPLKLKTREPLSLVVKEEPDGPARKRRKSKATNEFEEADDLIPEKLGPDRRKRSKTDVSLGSASPPAGESNGKRRRCSAKAASAKTARENLSEEQKRENHIKSEQKRRTLIKEGFDDLCALVPGLKGGGFSKSAMLTMAAEWLENMMEGNTQLKGQLKNMGIGQLEPDDN